MLDTTILDVFIGLLFIYLLYSLLASTLVEIMGSFMGLRARNLEEAIRRMLSDDDSRSYGKLIEWLITTLNDLGAMVYRSRTGMVRRFYNDPAIKYLGRGGFHRSPSYLSAQTFSRVLMDMLKESKGATDLEKISNSLGVETTRKFEVRATEFDALRAKMEAGRSDADALYHQVMEWIEAYPAKEGKTDRSVRLHVPAETKAHLRSLLLDAQLDLGRFRDNIESWFEETMERSTGWYKRKVRSLTFAIGILIVITFNVDTLRITQRLSSDREALATVVAMAQDRVGEADSITSEMIKGTRQDIDSLNAVISLGNGWVDSYQLCSPDGTNCKDQRYLHSGLSWVGWILTAIALSLGAQFWFDLLNRLVKLRSSVPTVTGGTPSTRRKNKLPPADG